MPTKIYRIKMHDNRFTVKQTYCEHDYVPRYWIWMNSYWNVRKSARCKGSSFCHFRKRTFISFLALSMFLFFDMGNEDCS